MILSIETSTPICSVALHDHGNLVSCFELYFEKSHSAQLSSLIEKLLACSGLKTSDLTAVAVSQGPGSYTGLRIGVSTAKGLCFGLGIPLLGVCSLEALAWEAANRTVSKTEAVNPEKLKPCFIPMIDARRDEVYSAVFDEKMDKIQEVMPQVVEKGVYDDLLSRYRVYLCGDGAKKSATLLENPEGLSFIADIHSSAKNIGALAYQKYTKGDFEDVAYFEPFYLKEFRTSVSTKALF